MAERMRARSAPMLATSKGWSMGATWVGAQVRRCDRARRPIPPKLADADKPPRVVATLSMFFGWARANRAAGLHLGLQAGDIQQVGERRESVLAGETGEIGRQFRNIAGGVARARLRWQIGAHVLAANVARFG